MDCIKKKSDAECTIAGLYDLSETIGKGHFAVVKLAKHVFTGEKVAVKVIDKTKLDPISRDHLFQEVRCMKLVQHPHIVRLYEVIDTQTKLYLILELGDGDMYDYIMNNTNHDRGLDVDTARLYFTQILEAISYCHDLHVVHRDLKPENVIFFEKLGIVKLTDFGFSNRFEPDTKLDTSCGSLAYSAPEILLGDAYDAPAVDVWSLGVLLYMLVCGDPPFQEANDSETLTMIMDCRYRVPPHIATDCANLISLMLRREPKERVSLGQIMNHPWMSRDGRQCCDNSLCVALVGKEHLPAEDQESIIQRMIEGGIASRAEILRALECDEYSNVTATYYLLAERRLKRHHSTDVKPALSRKRPTTVQWPPRLEHSLSTPDESSSCSASDRVTLEPSPKSAPYDQLDNVFTAENTFPSYSSASLQVDSIASDLQQRKFSLINEEDEEESETDDLRGDVQVVKESRSEATCGTKGSTSTFSQYGGAGGGSSPLNTDFEISLSNMSLRRSRQPTPQPSPPRPLRNVGSSPQLLPLKQIHEEQEMAAVASDEDALSTHSQTSVVRIRHSSLSMASPELARKLLHKKKMLKSKTQSGSDTSDNDEDKQHRDSLSTNCSALLSLPHKRKDSSDNSSDNDGPPSTAGSGSASQNTRGAVTQGSSKCDKGGNSTSSPCAKKKYSGNSRSCPTALINSSGCLHKDAITTTESSYTASYKTDSMKTSCTHISDSQKNNTNTNNKDCDNASLRVLANKFVDSSLARLSNFSLASQSSSISSRSSAKYSTNTTPRSSQRRSKDGNKFSKARLMKQLKMDFTEMSDRELTDSDCGSLHNSLRLKISASTTAQSLKECSVIAEEQTSQVHTTSSSKKATDCCSVM